MYLFFFRYIQLENTRALLHIFFLLACSTYGVSVPNGLFVPLILCSFMYIYFFRYIQLENTRALLHIFLPVGLLDVWCLCTKWSLCTFTLVWSSVWTICFNITYRVSTRYEQHKYRVITLMILHDAHVLLKSVNFML